MKQMALLVGLLLAACAGRDDGSYTLTGRYLGNPEKKIVEPEDGKLALPGGLMPIVEIKRATYGDRTVEVTEVESGKLYLSRVTGGGFRDRVSDREFRAMFQDEEETLVPERWLQITYAEFSVKGYSCLYFVRPIGLPQLTTRGGHPNHDGSLKGYLCAQEGESDFKNRALRFIEEVDLKGKRPDVAPRRGIEKMKATSNENT